MDGGWGRGIALLALLLAILALVAGGVGIAMARTGTSDSSSARTISAQGHGSVTITPDQATISLGVETRDPQIGAALSSNAARVKASIAAITGAGVPANDIQTTNLSLYQDTDHNVYDVTHTLTVRIDGIDRVGTVLEAATNAGANSSYGITYGLKDPSAAQARALRAALANARTRADGIASALGLTITGVRSESEAAAPSSQAPSGGLGGGGGGPSVQPGQGQVSTDVTVTYDVR